MEAAAGNQRQAETISDRSLAAADSVAPSSEAEESAEEGGSFAESELVESQEFEAEGEPMSVGAVMSALLPWLSN